MAPIALAAPSARAAAVTLLPRALRAVIPLLLIVGCVSRRPAAPIPPQVSVNDVAARVLIPPDIDVNSTETVVKPEPLQQSPEVPRPPVDAGNVSMTFSLPDAIEFGLQNNP